MDKTPETQAQSPSARESVVLGSKRGGIIGVKAGMTQVYGENGDVIAVTVIDLKQNVITQIKTKDKNGYQGIQIGFAEKNVKKATKSEVGHAKKAGAGTFYHYQEFRLSDADKIDSLAVGKVLSPGFIKAGDCVDLQARTKGKGFQGGMKRYHMAGGFKTHGASVTHRHTGSTGNRADPGKCFRNKKMAGQMGNVIATVQNVKVIRVDAENGLILVHGSVPGPKSAIVTVRKSVKLLG